MGYNRPDEDVQLLELKFRDIARWSLLLWVPKQGGDRGYAGRTPIFKTFRKIRYENDLCSLKK